MSPWRLRLRARDSAGRSGRRPAPAAPHRTEEQRLLERIDAVGSYAELKRLQDRIRANLGVELRITPGPNEVRTLRGILIVLEDRPGLCKKVRQSVPAAVRKVLERHPEITYAILDAHDLFGAHGA